MPDRDAWVWYVCQTQVSSVWHGSSALGVAAMPNPSALGLVDMSIPSHKVKLVRKSKCNEHETPYYGMINPHRLVTPSTN